MQREWNEAVFVIFRASKYQYEKYMYIYIMLNSFNLDVKIFNSDYRNFCVYDSG